MAKTRALLTFVNALFLSAGCSKNTSDSDGMVDSGTTSTTGTSTSVATTSGTGTTANLTTKGTTEASGSPATDASSTTSNSASDSASGTLASGSESSSGAPAMPCHLAFDKASCEAGVDCLFMPGREVFVPDGACVYGDLGGVGFCYYMIGGGPDSPSFYYEVETGRVFAFSNSPEPPEGWMVCTCGPPSPLACQLCWSDCNGGTSG